MSDDRKAQYMTDMDVQEKIRSRQQRNRWGSAVAVIGIVAALVAAFWRGDYALTALFLGVGLVGAGFVDPSTFTSRFGRDR